MKLTALALPLCMAALTSVPADPPTKRNTLTLESGSHTAQSLIDRSAVFLGRNHIFSESVLDNNRSQISLQNKLVLDQSDCESAISQLLFSMGYVQIPMQPELGIWKVIATQGPERNLIADYAVKMDVDKVLAMRNTKICVSCPIPIGRGNVNAIVTALRPLVQGQGNPSMVTSPDPNTIIVKGYANVVANAIEIVKKSEQASTAQRTERRPDSKTQRALRKIHKRLAKLEAIANSKNDDQERK